MKRRVLITVSAVGLGAAALSGVSLAYWTESGNSAGTAQSATNLSGVTVQSVAVSDFSTPGMLIPGGSADVVVKVANSNSFPVTITSIATTAGQSVTADNNCTPTGVDLHRPGRQLGRRRGQRRHGLVLGNAASMDNTSASACQGTTFRIPVTVTARQ